MPDDITELELSPGLLLEIGTNSETPESPDRQDVEDDSKYGVNMMDTGFSTEHDYVPSPTTCDVV